MCSFDSEFPSEAYDAPDFRLQDVLEYEEQQQTQATEEDKTTLMVTRDERELLRESIAFFLAAQSKPAKIKSLWDLGNRI